MADSDSTHSDGISRKKFMGLTALGAAGAVAALAIQRGIPGLSPKKKIVQSDLPSGDSIFAPKNPPRA